MIPIGVQLFWPAFVLPQDISAIGPGWPFGRIVASARDRHHHVRWTAARDAAVQGLRRLDRDLRLARRRGFAAREKRTCAGNAVYLVDMLHAVSS